ncbi:unnamed protein product [Cuscuta europaea]|uniref:F-box domain-containing protein n=1 Tax=Cuscuta europaea TaxID=41803 RepID=A0A9P0YVP7_CUSEU|nr:unnamed protein product [Cuscuta europaea]
MADRSTVDLPSLQLIPGLPYDVAMRCLARIPPLFHPTLSLVCKSWSSAVRSDALFTARSPLRTTQVFLYFIIRINSSLHLYALFPCWEPRKAVSLPSIPSAPIGAAFAVLGRKIYVIGGSINDIPSNKVWIFDCWFNRWEMGPRMKVGREFAAAGVVGGRIYVIGGCVVDNWVRSRNWAEIFDPVSHSWSALPSPIDIKDKWMHASTVMDGKLYAMADRGGLVYNIGVGRWETIPKRLYMGWRGRPAVVGEVLYCYDCCGNIRGYDVKEDGWKELKGIDEGLPRFLCGATMANSEEKLCVTWERNGSSCKGVEIMCAQIKVGKDENGDMCGILLWSDVILSVLKGSSVEHCIAVDM